MNTKSNCNKILLSIIINNFGDVLFDLFIVWRITRETNDIMSPVYMIGSSILFRAVLSIFIGFLVDRFNKKKMVIVSNISSTFVIILFVFSFSFIKSNIILGIIFILFNDINNAVFSRSTMLITSELLDKETFIKFQAKYNVINRIIIIAGSSIVGFLISIVPDISIFLIDIATFLLSTVLVLFVNYKPLLDKSGVHSIKAEFIKLKNDIFYIARAVRTNKFIVKFIIIMFILNIAYGYIPYILPIKIANENISPSLFGFIKSSIAIGEVIGLSFISFFAKKVSWLFKISMVGNAIIMGLLSYSESVVLTILCFLMYGLLDSITQPLFGYTISIIDEKNRGKVLGGIESIVLLSPSLGMFVISKIMNFNATLGYFSLIIVFIIVYLIVRYNSELNNIDLGKE